MGEARTDVGTFLFRIPSQANGAKVTVEYAHSSESVVFYLYHHGPGKRAAVQLSGCLLEVEANEKLIGKVWQAEEDNQFRKRWQRDRRCMECNQDRKRSSPVCNSCLMEAIEGAFAKRQPT